MEGRSPCRENNDSLPVQIPRCDTHFVQFKEEKLIQLGLFLLFTQCRWLQDDCARQLIAVISNMMTIPVKISFDLKVLKEA